MVIKINYTSSDVYVSTSVSPVYVVVNYSGVSGGGGAVWGGITGTLSDQTDLQTALDAKFDDPTGTTSQYLRGDGSLATFPALTGYVPYTGATANVDLGEYELKAGQLTLDVSPTGTAAVGTTRWNNTIGSSETTLKGGSVILKNGVDLVARVVNKVTPNATLTKAAYQAVRVSGAQGQRLAVAYAQANSDNNSADTIGLVTETIATNQEGFIITVGQIEGINTTGSLQGETWADGDVLYLSPTTAGAITNIKPVAPGHIVVIGYVEYAHANNGKIYVKTMNGWELDELHNVAISSPANNEALIYESSTSLWKNKTIATALGYTPQAALTLTTTGTSGAATLVGATLNIPQYSGGGGTTIYSGDGTLAGNRVLTANGNSLTFLGGIEEYGGAQIALRLQGSTTGKDIYLSLKNTGASGKDYAFRSLTDGKFEILNYTNLSLIYSYNPATSVTTLSPAIKMGNTYLGSGSTLSALWFTGTTTTGDYAITQAAGSTFVNAPSGGGIYFRVNNTDKALLTSSGRLLLGTTTESTFILDAVGTARVSGQMSINGYTISSPASGTIKVGTNPNTTGTNVTAFGEGAISTNGYTNSSAFGQYALGIGSGLGNRVTGFGWYAGYYNAASFNTYIGSQSGFYQTTGQNNVFLGDNAGSLIGSGAILTIANNSILIGQATRALADNQTNQIVIGHASVGLGSNTTVIGNSSTTDTAIYGRMLVNYSSPVIGTYALDVNGTARVSGSTTFGTVVYGTSGMFWDNTNNRLGIGISNPNNTIHITKNQNAVTSIIIDNKTAGTGSASVLEINSDGSSALNLGKFSSTTNTYKTIVGGDSYLANFSVGDISIINDFSTGKIKFAAGGASTAHMTIKSDGKINFSSLPTSSAGLSSGDIWNDGGTLKIV